jgi:phage baseplate assembly protein V
MKNTIRHVVLKNLNTNPKISTANVDGHVDEDMEDRPFIEQFGFSSHPPQGSKGIALCPDNTVEKAVIVGLHSEDHAQALGQGEACFYDANGNKFLLKSGGVEITVNGVLNLTVSGQVNLKCSKTNIETSSLDLKGNLNVTGNTQFNGNVGSSGGSFSIGGSGAAKIARVGDAVQIDGRVGTIISGSSIASSQ